MNEVSRLHSPDRLSILSGFSGPVNAGCHSYTGGVTAHDGRVLANPIVFSLFWGSNYTRRDQSGAVLGDHPCVASMIDFMKDLMGDWLLGLNQYGVQSGIAFSPGTVEQVQPGADPTSLTSAQIETQLISFLNSSQPHNFFVPDQEETRRCYVLFLPNTLAISDEVGACGYHWSTRFNKASGTDNLFYAIISTYGVSASLGGDDFVNNISYCVSHELAEMFSNPDQHGYYADADAAHGRSQVCEIGDICETKGLVTYHNKWTVEQYWSQKAGACLDPSTLEMHPTPQPPHPPIPIPHPPQPQNPTCEALAQQLVHLESQIATLTRQPPSPSRTSQLQLLERELGTAQAHYHQLCHR